MLSTPQRQIDLWLPRPHPAQLPFVTSQAKRKVLVAGRRSGKTTGAGVVATKGLLSGKRVLEAAPTAFQTNAFWEKVVHYLQPLISSGDVLKNETERLLRMPSTGGLIRCKTAHDANSLRGDYADLLILDEFSFMKYEAWGQVGAPMLLDNGGDAIFIFTPFRKNHAYALYQRALADDRGRWGAWHFSSLENPHLDGEALDELTEDMTEEDYQQEILAKFLDNAGAVFRRLALGAPLDTRPEDHDGHLLVAGVDWANQQDYSAISIGCATCGHEVYRDRFNKVGYTIQRGWLMEALKAWQPQVMLGELNSIGEPVMEQLESDLATERLSTELMGFQTTATSKGPLIRSLVLAMEQGEWQFQDDPVWNAELEAYEATKDASTGRIKYSGVEGVHDDTVIARALMVWQSKDVPELAENVLW